MKIQDSARVAYLNAKAMVKRANVNPGSVVLCQGVLRTEQAINTAATTYTFPTSNNQTGSVPTNTSKLLDLQDAFFVSQLGIYLAVPTSATAVNFRLLSYPAVGSITNTAALFTASQAQDALALYNGILTLTVNQRTILTSWDVQRHLQIPAVQVNAFYNVKTGATSALVAPEHYNEDNYNGAEDGLYPVEPNIVINGKDKNELQITLPGAIATAPANARIVIVMRGVLAQNINPLGR